MFEPSNALQLMQFCCPSLEGGRPSPEVLAQAFCQSRKERGSVVTEAQRAQLLPHLTHAVAALPDIFIKQARTSWPWQYDGATAMEEG